VVCKALDSESAQLVAVKRTVFGPDDGRAKEGFQREVRFLQDLEHANIVQLIEVDRDEAGRWFLVLEWIEENLEEIILRDGPMPWQFFWDRFGRPLLDAIVFGQQRQVAHRDVKPRNILVTEAGIPKLADYGIGKLLDNGGSWQPVAGVTLRFDRTPGYSPAKPEDERYDYSRDCFGFAAVAVSCVAGRLIKDDADVGVVLEEAALPDPIRSVLGRCLSQDPTQRPILASILREQLEEADAKACRSGAPKETVHVVINGQVLSSLERRLGLEEAGDVERFIQAELAEVCALLPGRTNEGEQLDHLDLIGATWRFDCVVAGRHGESLHLARATEIGASLAMDLRQMGLDRSVEVSFKRARDIERAGQILGMLLAEARAAARDYEAERQARATQRVFRLWKGYLRDRADIENKRGNAIRYTDRKVEQGKVVFVTEIAQSDEIVGQERLVQLAGSRVGGRIAAVSFNRVVMDVTFGEPHRLPHRGELSINTVAAQKALTNQAHALDAVVYDRAVSRQLKPIILDPACARPPAPVEEVTPSSDNFDAEKTSILRRALGVQDVLAIQGPPGTGKTKLITEIVLQWLRRNPESRILLSSQTHIALDNVLERVSAVDPAIKAIRIGKTDDPKISEKSQKLLLDRRVEEWIREVRSRSESEMNRWADAHGVDRRTIEVGMKVERLLQVLRAQEEVRQSVEKMVEDLSDVEGSAEGADGSVDREEIDEEATQLDSEIGQLQQRVRELEAEEAVIRDQMRGIGGYAAELADSEDRGDLADWAVHFLQPGKHVEECRARLALLEQWMLRVGRSSDFNAALLSSAQVIAGTCVGIASVKGMEEVAYDLCIVDEASKATATEILIPMVRSRRWIIVGDPKQLPPFFETFGDELGSEFEESELKATMLDRFLDEQDGLPESCRAELRNQYRMIEPIGELVSQCFYEGRLNSPVKSHGLRLDTVLPKPVTWYSTHDLGHRSERSQGQTFANPCEVNAVRDVLKKLQWVAKAQKRRISVAVIAGYTAQVALLREMEARHVADWPDLDLTCNSVDAFQGRQADICIYSVVRSNPRHDLGFLREPPRLNVALSRGMSGLVIVGDQLFCRTAGGRNPFRMVLEYIERHTEDCAMETLQ
jgi:hypothetical protein